MQLCVIRRTGAWANLKVLDAARARSGQIGNDEMSNRVRWIRSYVVNVPDAGSESYASKRRATETRSVTTRVAWACRARNSIPSRPW
jgi:hypothetical protein